MKKFLVLGFVLLVFAGGATVSRAQYGGPPPGGPAHHPEGRIRDELADHERRIYDGVHNHDLSHHQADHLRAKEDEVRRRLDDILGRQHGFISPEQFGYLQGRMDDLDQEIHRARHHE